MNLSEARSKYRRPPEIEPILTGGEEADDFADLSDEAVLSMADKVFALGDERKKQLDAVLKQNGSGDYVVPNAATGDHTDFCDQANHAYLHDKYPWLHFETHSIGIDDTKANESHGSLEKFLASVPHEDWESFLTDVEGMEDYYCLDDDAASELEMKEAGRWMDEDGAPDLIKALVKERDDSYEAYLLSKVTPELVWEWSRETDHYPEADGDGGVWMDMEKLAAQSETQEWFLEHIDDDVAGWLAIKRGCYDQVVSDLESGLKSKRASDMFDYTLRDMATTDEQIAHVYNRIDAAILWEMFQQAFPDERREDEDPYWYRWQKNYQTPLEWQMGYEPDHGSWVRGYQQALNYLKQVAWFRKLVAGWFDRPPEGHPELHMEALEAEPNPDDAETFVRHGGGLREELIYDDANIAVLYPRDVETLNHHLRRMGLPEITAQTWQMVWKGNDKDVFVIIGKEKNDLLGHAGKREIGVLVGDYDKLLGYNGNYAPQILTDLLTHPEYGHSINRMLKRYYREQAQHNSSYAPVLMQLGGVAELRRLARRGDFDLSTYAVPIGLHYIARKKYRLAAKAFNRPPETIEATGVWLVYGDVTDLIGVFKNEDGAQAVFDNETHDWFSHYYEQQNRPAVDDVTPFLSPDAIKHLREVLLNRRVWFPDGGPDGEGEYVLLTKKLLDGYDDETIMTWLEKPSEQDQEDGVFDDIYDAIKLAGADILSAASVDEVYTGYVKAAVKAIDGIQHKWGTSKTKATKSGPESTFEVFVRWPAVQQWAKDYQENNGSPFEGSLEDLAVEANRDSTDPDVSNMEASWRDVKKEWAAEQLDRVFQLEAPELEPLPEPRDQIPLPLGENATPEEEARAAALMKEYGVDQPDYDLAKAEREADAKGHTQHQKKIVGRQFLRKFKYGEALDPDSPEAMGDQLLSGVPIDFERQVKAILKDSTEAHQYTVRDLDIKMIPSQEYSEEEIDASDGRLYNRLGPHVILLVSYLPTPAPEWEVTHGVFQKVYGAATNAYQAFFLTDPHLLNPVTLEGNLPEDMVIMQFHLFFREKQIPAAPPEDADEVPF